MDLQKFVTVAMAVDSGEFSRQHMYRLIWAGRIKAFRLGSVWLVDRDSLKAYKNRASCGKGRKTNLPVGGNSRYVGASKTTPVN